jgi:hypothetical protein
MTVKNEKIQIMVEQYNKLKAEMVEEGKKVFKDSFKDFFESNPKIVAFSWTQYTPYFNDGEPCYFGVGDIWPLTEKGLEDFKESGRGYAEEYSVGTYGEDKYKEGLDEEELKTVDDFASTIMSLPNEIFEDLFGDGVSVLATREGFEVEDYEHD